MAWTPWRGLHFASIKATTGLSLAKTHNESLPNPSKLESKAETLARLPCSVIHQKSFTGSPLGIENKDLPFLLGSNINLHKTGADHQSAVFFCTYMTRERTGTISSVSSKNVKNPLVLNSLLFLFFQTWTLWTLRLTSRQTLEAFFRTCGTNRGRIWLLKKHSQHGHCRSGSGTLWYRFRTIFNTRGLDGNIRMVSFKVGSKLA